MKIDISKLEKAEGKEKKRLCKLYNKRLWEMFANAALAGDSKALDKIAAKLKKLKKLCSEFLKGEF